MRLSPLLALALAACQGASQAELIRASYADPVNLSLAVEQCEGTMITRLSLPASEATRQCGCAIPVMMRVAGETIAADPHLADDEAVALPELRHALPRQCPGAWELLQRLNDVAPAGAAPAPPV